jgi:hypothetical protein
VTRVTPQVIEFANGTHRIGLTKEQLPAIPFRIEMVENRDTARLKSEVFEVKSGSKCRKFDQNTPESRVPNY